MRKKTAIVLLLGIVAIASVLRLWRLGEVPVGFHRDEAFLGYNAYSILKTTKDVSGARFPLHLESFLFSPAGYSYASMPFIAAFGLSEFSVRLASAVFGALTVVPLFLLVCELFPVRKRLGIALVASSFLALQPWHVNLSRVATEHVVAVFFILWGMWGFMRWVGTKATVWLWFSYGLWFVSLWIYQAPRAFLPVFVSLLAIIVWRRVTIPSGRAVLLLTVAGLLVPVVWVMIVPTLSLRLRTVSSFATSESALIIAENIREDGTRSVPTLVARLFHNKPMAYSLQVLQTYFRHLSFDFFFTDAGKPDRYRVPGVGLLLLGELPLLLLGVLALRSHARETQLFLTFWFAASFVGSALTFDDIPNLQRTVMGAPAIAIVESLGVMWLVGSVRRRFFRIALLSGMGFLYGYFFLSYVHSYYVHQLVHRPWYRQEGYRELAAAVNARKSDYARVVVTARETAPYIFFLFYNRYNPSTFLAETGGIGLTNADTIAFGGYVFSNDECPLRIDKQGGLSSQLTGTEGVLYVNSGLCKEGVSGIRQIATIERNDKSPAFRLVEVAAR